jgi:hypothetical protein
VVHRRPCLTLVVMCGGRDTPHARAARLPIVVVIVFGHGPLRVMLALLFAALDALLSAVDGDIGWHLLAAAWGRLPTSLGWIKHDYLIAGGVLGGDATRLLKYVPEKVAMLTLEQVSCAALSQRANARVAACLLASLLHRGTTSCSTVGYRVRACASCPS